MHESFLHFLWRFRRFDAASLLTTQGEPLEILHPGEHNSHAGPDFFNARIRIGNTLWAGNVEIHLRASEWYAHRHEIDPAYENVVLHVVLEEDAPVIRANGDRIPCLELQQRISEKLYSRFRLLEAERSAVPCRHFWTSTPEIVRINWLDRMSVERLEYKADQVNRLLQSAGNNWDETIFRLLGRYFGLKINTEPFECLVSGLPLNLLLKHRNNRFQLEALLFGQAGMLQAGAAEEYPQSLAREYHFLQHKYGLVPMDGGAWKFLRLRPANFPTLRIAQFACLVQRAENLASRIIEIETLKDLEAFFDIQLDGYWLDHYHFGKGSIRRPKSLGSDFVRLLAINAVIPFTFCYGKWKGRESLTELALHLLEQMPPEKNAALAAWDAFAGAPAHARDTQALLQLKQHWCEARKCLECGIGNALLK